MDQYKNLLAPYIPEITLNPIAEWLYQNRVQLKISRTRVTKLGDYRVDRKNNSHSISVNHDLNTYAFLITLVHEMAHAEAWKKKSRFRRIKPHGPEWQNAFSELMRPFLNENVFPKELLPIVERYFIKPKASSVSDPKLMAALKAYDKPTEQLILNEFTAGDAFVFRNTNYTIIKKMRTRFQCRNMQNNRLYLIHGLAEVDKPAE